MRSTFRSISLFILILQLALFAGCAARQTADRQKHEPPRKIAVFGSSVAHGSCDHENKGGYCGRLGDLLKSRGWEVINVSRGGDNTIKIAPRFESELLPKHPGYVIIGLSLSNEGIAKEKDRAYRDGIFEQWKSGVAELARRCRAAGMTPIVGNCYARDSFAEDSDLYDYTRRMNVEIGKMDVPSINFMGAVDDGSGAWAKGMQWNAGHPNGSGHQEMCLTIVPSLFEALEGGKPLPTKAAADRWAHQPGGEAIAGAFSHVPRDTIHSYAVSFWLRPENDGAIAEIRGHELQVKTEQISEKDKFIPVRTFHPKKSTAYTGLSVLNGALFYAGRKQNVLASKPIKMDEWHHVVISHNCARGITQLFLDGVSVGMVEERLMPTGFVLSGMSYKYIVAKADYREWSIYRSSLSPEQVRFLYEGGLFPSSMEVYAPLADPAFVPGSVLENRAQSMAEVIVDHKGVAPGNPNPGS